AVGALSSRGACGRSSNMSDASDNISIVAVIGAGTMGHGIAQVCAMAGAVTRLTDVAQPQVDAGLAKIAANLDAGIARGKLDEASKQATLARLSGTVDLAEAVRNADLVVEAAPERLELKRDIFTRVAAVVDEHAVLGTNTSSLSITDIAAPIPHPERVIGLHFFNPVHIMKLLEIVVGERTDETVTARMRAFAERIGKQPIVVKD